MIPWMVCGFINVDVNLHIGALNEFKQALS